MRSLEVKTWKKVALDRDEWAKLLKKGRVPPGFVEPMRMLMGKVCTDLISCFYVLFRGGV
jgi:hypothetical protein